MITKREADIQNARSNGYASGYKQGKADALAKIMEALGLMDIFERIRDDD